MVTSSGVENRPVAIVEAAVSLIVAASTPAAFANVSATPWSLAERHEHSPSAVCS
jgi:hypothetical protein